MMRLGVIAIVIAVGWTAGADELRAAKSRASSDLRCPAKKVKVDLYLDGGVEKIEGRGCGRSAEYFQNGDELELALLEIEPTPSMATRASSSRPTGFIAALLLVGANTGPNTT